MPQCFYLAGSSQVGEGLQLATAEIERRGWMISFDWTNHPSVKPYKDHPVEATHFAERALAGAQECDIFVLFPEQDGGTTQFTELGAALFSARVQQVFVVGSYNTRSLAFFHPKVKRVASFEEAINGLE